MNSFMPFFFMFCMLSETVVSVSISADRPYPIIGDQVILTCSITGFSAPASWSNSATGAVLTTCFPGGPCSSTSLGTYSFSANASAIVVQISSFALSDNFGWKCQHDVNTFVFTFVFTTTTTSTPSTSTSTTTKETVTSTSSPSTSMSSTTIKATANSTSATHTAKESTATASISTSSSTNTATGSSASASSSTSASKSPTAGSTVTATSTSKPTTPETVGSTSPTNTSSQGGTDTKVIVIAVVVPIGGLLLIAIIVWCIMHRWTEKKGHDIPDGMAAQDRGNNVHGFKHDWTAKQFNAMPTTSNGFIIYPGPAAMSTARPNKERKYLDVGYQYRTPYTGYQTAYFPSTYPSAKSSTHKDTKHHNVGHSRPYTRTYGNQTAYSPKNKSYDYESPYQIAASRPAYDLTAYYRHPQTGYYEQIGQDMYQRGSGQYSYGQRSRPHQDHNGRQKQREYYYNQYEMADYEGSRTRYGQTKQYGLGTAIFY